MLSSETHYDFSFLCAFKEHASATAGCASDTANLAAVPLKVRARRRLILLCRCESHNGKIVYRFVNSV